MRILREGEVPERANDWLLREAQPAQLFALLVYLGILGGAVFVAFVAWREHATAMAIGADLLALLFLAIVRLQLRVWRASLAPGNWTPRKTSGVEGRGLIL
ncbi:MAG: hypothetical protein FJX68_16455 [Alphaproteobacteria bacterium]|nr:hypothetical protein [Alphaproteobacteria bacterium]